MAISIRLQQSKFKEANRGGKWHARIVATEKHQQPILLLLSSQTHRLHVAKLQVLLWL